MQVIDLASDNAEHINQAAMLLIEGFATFSPTSWRTFAEAIEDSLTALASEKSVGLRSRMQELSWAGLAECPL
ncbi:MAG: hypothetical protein R2932_16910 [Caldilineaceae bacterium]